jgi:exosortase
VTSSLATKPETRPGFPIHFSSLPWIDWALLAGASLVALRPLSQTWSSNSNYSFGWWIPFVCVLLFSERWPGRPPQNPVGKVRLVLPLILWGLFFFAFRLAAETDNDWRPGLWILVSLYVAVFLYWLRLYGGTAWMRYFAFPVCFLLLSLPWFYEIEHPLVQGLMRWNTVLVAHSLQAIEISAEPVGNTIQLPNCQLGVEEACSGILSLQASLVIGFLFGEIYRFSIWRRIILVLGGMMLALIGNYLRTFFLAMVAFYSGAEAVTRWHDTAGYAILIFTGVGSWLGAFALDTWKMPPIFTSQTHANIGRGDSPRLAPVARRLAVLVFLAALLSEAVTQSWYGWKELSMIRHPQWNVVWPASESFQDITLSETTLEALRCDAAHAGQWQDAQGFNWSAYWFRYDPKPYTRTALNWHNPDNCLPAVGLTKDKDYPDFKITLNGLDLIVQPKGFLAKDRPVYVFWLVYPDRGEIQTGIDTQAQAHAPFASKFRLHLQDVWNGYRGIGVETLEVGLAGPTSYEAAQADYIAGLKAIIKPVASAANDAK